MGSSNGSPAGPDAVIDAALALRDAGRADEALPLVAEALKRHPGDARLWQLQGLLHRALEDSGAAIVSLREAARLAPDNARIAHAHARVTAEAGLPALDLYERARSLAPLDGDLIVSRAGAQLAEGKGKQAIAELDALLASNPQWLPGQALLANLRWMLGEREGFVAGYERAIAAFPRQPSLWLALIERLIHGERHREADEAVARGRAAAGSNIGFDVAEAVCASELGDAARADRLFAALAAVRDVPFVVRHIRHLLRTGRVEEAHVRCEPLLGLPDAGQAWPYAAIIWRLLGDDRWRWLEEDPRLVGVYDIMDADEVAALRARLVMLHNTLGDPIGQSVRGGTQTDGPLFARVDPEIRALRARIVDTVADHTARFGTPDPTHPILRYAHGAPVRFAGSWSVRLTGAGHHTHHIHPLGWISSAFYVTVPGASEAGPAPAGWLALGQPPAELGIDLPPFRLIEPRPGRLALFPSLMWHGTMPFEAGERMTVAFDVAHPPG